MSKSTTAVATTRATKAQVKVVANNTKVNKKVNLEALYEELNACTTKHMLVDTMNKHGLRTTTIPTDTPNLNDLYIQFGDKSRLLIGRKSLKLYTSADRVKDFAGIEDFDIVNDGSYRTRRATVSKSVDAFKVIMAVMLKDERNYLPQ